MVTNPNVPVTASFPVPPPVGNFPLVDPGTGIPTPMGWEFLQKLWAAIQGSGGLIDTGLLTALRAGIPGIDGIDGEDGISVPGPQGNAGPQGVQGVPGLDGDPGEEYWFFVPPPP